jgi:hypothetical protein
METEVGISIPPSIAFLKDFTEAHTVDQLRMYDQAVYDWLSTFRFSKAIEEETMACNFPVDPQKPLHLVFATPRRGYAEISNITNREHPVQVRERDKIIKPIEPTCSITRRGVRKNQNRWSMAHVRYAGFVDEAKKERYQIPYPVPITISYQIEFTSINRSIMNAIQTWLLLQFDDDRFYVTIDPKIVHEGVYITPYVVPIIGDGIEDNSDLEVTDQDRNLRITLDASIEGWLFRPAKRTKSVHTAQIIVDP